MKHGDVADNGTIYCVTHDEHGVQSYWVDCGIIAVTKEQAQQAAQHGWEVIPDPYNGMPSGTVWIRRA